MMNDHEIKKEIRLETGMLLGRSVQSREEIQNIARSIFEQKQKQKKFLMDSAGMEKIIEAICDDFLGLGPLQKLMDDSEITEVMINGPHTIYVEKKGKKMLLDDQFDNEDHLRNIVEKMLGPSGRRVDESSPYVDFSLKDGSRVNVIISPLAVDGTTVTIRKFLYSIQSLENLIDYGTIDERMAAFLRAAMKAKLNMLFSGATGSGKTSTVNVLSGELDPQERIITIEDALELQLRNGHGVRLLTRSQNIEGKGEVSVRNLFSNTLRMRPSRIILGEIRGEEAMDYLQAINSGHNGTLAVLHASTPVDAAGRLETLALYSGVPISSSEIRRQIASGLNLIIQHEQLADGSRKITYITEVCGFENNLILLKDIFRYELQDTDEKGKITGCFKACGKPNLLSRLNKKGIRLDEKMFLN
jgi:pilus assembly protein CpaF